MRRHHREEIGRSALLVRSIRQLLGSIFVTEVVSFVTEAVEGSAEVFGSGELLVSFVIEEVEGGDEVFVSLVSEDVEGTDDDFGSGEPLVSFVSEEDEGSEDDFGSAAIFVNDDDDGSDANEGDEPEGSDGNAGSVSSCRAVWFNTGCAVRTTCFSAGVS